MRNETDLTNGDEAARRYRRERIAHWEKVSDNRANQRFWAGKYYHRLLEHYYRFLVKPGQRVIELGCGQGDLLASLNPSFGVGVDFSYKAAERASKRYPELIFVAGDAMNAGFDMLFDVVILSDLVNDLWDLQTLLESVKRYIHPESRIILNFYNNLWRIPLSAARQFGLGFDVLEQNWFSPHDVHNILELTGFEVIKDDRRVLLPLRIPGLAKLCNRYLVHLAPFAWFALTNFVTARLQPRPTNASASVSVVIPARNESGNISRIIERTPQMGRFTELIFVEGGSSDGTYEAIRDAIPNYPDRPVSLHQQSGKGKGDAVRCGFNNARGEILMILDADMTVPPEDLPRFFDAIVSGKGEFINGVRLVYPMENYSMRFLNIVGNKFFSLAFSWLLGQPLKDTLCGTKVIWNHDYQQIVENRSYFGDFDPFGDFDLIFGAAKLNLKIIEVPIRYRSRTYGDTNISRWRHGWMLLKMVAFAARRIKFI